jgi:hypothetical protein
MAKIKRLRDLYRFPGFVPLPPLRGIFGDPLAVVISLQRRRKKRRVASVARSIGHTTINAHDRSAISLVETNASTSLSGSDGSTAPGVGP